MSESEILHIEVTSSKNGEQGNVADTSRSENKNCYELLVEYCLFIVDFVYCIISSIPRLIFYCIIKDMCPCKHGCESSVWNCNKIRNCLSSFNWPRKNDVLLLLKKLFIIMIIPRLIGTVVFLKYDMRCILFEKKSILNCEPDHVFGNELHWIIAWFFMSIVSSIILIIIFIWDDEYQFKREKIKVVYKKGSFCSFFFFMVVTVVFHIVRLFSGKRIFSSLLFLLAVPIFTALVCIVNFVDRVPLLADKTTETRSLWERVRDKKVSKNWFYWLALLINFVESLSKFTSVLLDVVEDLTPIIDDAFPNKSKEFRGVLLMLIGFRLAFHARVLGFFYNKIFHGDKDLLTEPCTKLANNGGCEFGETNGTEETDAANRRDVLGSASATGVRDTTDGADRANEPSGTETTGETGATCDASDTGATVVNDVTNGTNETSVICWDTWENK
ncbi:uncharacterized protein LOC124436660 [Xenia sp. Carnegie-2017]|uniref:uncharacterized protein LOC124436660 n=1 Tax=Xenia sp. Carnegie-2017 TaxID=2897299 RepID=UPI001F04F110|nr:uncharacterized protein LOC124436660 [Xenia sp. Carnegie-2017]XP_046842588.1 uncharacterized protein LOC124436660 [Xenia sp. Carnegie-2017]